MLFLIRLEDSVKVVSNFYQTVIDEIIKFLYFLWKSSALIVGSFKKQSIYNFYYIFCRRIFKNLNNFS